MIVPHVALDIAALAAALAADQLGIDMCYLNEAAPPADGRRRGLLLSSPQISPSIFLQPSPSFSPSRPLSSILHFCKLFVNVHC